MTIVARREENYLVIEMAYERNSFTLEFLQLLTTWLKRAETDREIRAIILCSTSKVFSVGGDLDLMMEGVERDDPAIYVKEIVPKVSELIFQMLKHPLPIITILNGAAAGGGMSLFLAGDYRIVGPRGKLVTAFANLALPPDSGTSMLMPLRFGRDMTVALSRSETFLAEDLMENRVANELVDEENLMVRAKEIAQSYGAYDRWTVARTKELINRPILEVIRDVMEMELDYIILACKRPQFEERLRSLLKREIE